MAGGCAGEANDAEAWSQALAGRAALVAGDLDTLAATIDDDPLCSVLYSPARHDHGALDPAEVTAALLEIHQIATIGDLTDMLTQPPA
jgi:hypothetical protein